MPDQPQVLNAVFWDRLRAEEFTVAEHWAYFDHAAVCPLPRRSAAALRAWTDDLEHNGLAHWADWERKVERVRTDLARLINADAEEVAFVANTTTGIGLVAEGFPWNDGDNVVTAADEYPSNLYPWMNLASRGVALRQVPTRDGRIWPEDLLAAIDGRTRVLTISHVEFATGFRNNLDLLCDLCQQRGVALFVDAIQGLGPHAYDVRRTPIDFLCADGHKWLLGPEGAGLLYVRRDWIERLRPTGVGWHSVTTSHNNPSNAFRLKPSAARWEGGTLPVGAIQALGASVGLFLEAGPAAMSRRILDRAERVRELAESCGWGVHGSRRADDVSAIVALEHPDADVSSIARAGREQGIVVASRRGRLRISAHVYNDDNDLERLGALLRSAAGRRP